MRGIPPEIDRLMWAVAEQGNPGAEAEFLRRYPLYRDELLRRREAVSGLKTGRPKAAAQPKPIPRFVPRETIRPSPRPTMALAVGAMFLVSVAVASYTVTTMLSPVANHSLENTIPPQPAPQPPANQTDTGTHPGEEHRDPTWVDPNQVPHDTPPPPTPAPVEVPAYEKPQSLVVKRAGLIDVLKLLGAETGMQVVMAPGMPNPTIAVEYHDMTAMEMLNDLGNQYHFTPFDQGDGSVVVYPVEKGPAGAGNLRKLGG